MEDAQKKINVVIAGRTFPVRVTDDEELSVRNIEKDINSKIQEFRQKYADKDKLDLVIMVLLTQAFELEKVRTIEVDIRQAHTQLDAIDATLDQIS